MSTPIPCHYLACLLPAFLPALPALAEEMADEVFRRVSASVVTVLVFDEEGKPAGQGSAVSLGGGRYATNCHVVRHGASIRVAPAGKAATEKEAVWRLRDPSRDVCLLESPELVTPPAKLRKSDRLRVGETVVAVGNPLGLQLSASTGLIAAVRGEAAERVIVTTAPLSPGSSGGGLFDGEGYLVGITTAITGFGQSINLALPAEWIEELSQRGLPPPTITLPEAEPDWIGEAGRLAHGGEPSDLEAFARRWRQSQPMSSRAAEFLGIALRRQERLAEAKAALLEAVRHDADNPSAWLELAVVLDSLGQREEADGAIAHARQGRPWMPGIHFFEARRQFAAGLPEAALQAANQALRRGPGNSSLWLLRGRIKEQLKMHNEAVADLRMALRLGGPASEAARLVSANVGIPVAGTTSALRSVEALITLGIAEQNWGRLAEAERAFRKATELAPGLADGWNGLGNVLATLGRLDEALAALDKAVELRPDLPEPRNNRALIQARAGRREVAVQEQRTVVREHPNFANGLRSLAYLQAEKKQYAEVATLLDRVVALGEANANDRSLLAEALQFLGRDREAQAGFEEILRGDPKHFHALLGLGGLHGRRGEFEASLGYLERAIEVDGTAAPAWSSKGYLLLRQGRYSEAASILETAVRLDPALGNAWINLGEAHLRAKSVGRAIQALDKALALLPDAIDARIFLSQAYLGTNQAVRGRQEAERILKREPRHPPALGLLTLGYLMEGNLPKARESHEQLRLIDVQQARRTKGQALAARLYGAGELRD